MLNLNMLNMRTCCNVLEVWVYGGLKVLGTILAEPTYVEVEVCPLACVTSRYALIW